MTCIIVDADEWNNKMLELDGMASAKESINTENPFSDDAIVLISRDGDNWEFTCGLNKVDERWNGKAYCNRIGATIHFSDLTVLDDEGNCQLGDFECDIDLNKESDDWMKSAICSSVHVLWYMNNRDTHFTKPQRHIRRRLERSSPILSKGEEYFVLDIGKKPSRKSDSNGDGSGKRYHLRRGHYSTYHTKKGTIRKWIKPVWCGDETLGRINKTYKV